MYQALPQKASITNFSRRRIVLDQRRIAETLVPTLYRFMQYQKKDSYCRNAVFHVVKTIADYKEDNIKLIVPIAPVNRTIQVIVTQIFCK